MICECGQYVSSALVTEQNAAVRTSADFCALAHTHRHNTTTSPSTSATGSFCQPNFQKREYTRTILRHSRSMFHIIRLVQNKKNRRGPPESTTWKVPYPFSFSRNWRRGRIPRRRWRAQAGECGKNSCAATLLRGATQLLAEFVFCIMSQVFSS